MITLRLLGGPRLSSSGKTLGLAAARKRPLALIAIIAASGSGRASREQACFTCSRKARPTARFQQLAVTLAERSAQQGNHARAIH